jgi:hypothetical protein
MYVNFRGNVNAGYRGGLEFIGYAVRSPLFPETIVPTNKSQFVVCSFNLQFYIVTVLCVVVIDFSAFKLE